MKKFVCLIIVLCFFVSINAVAGNLEPSEPPTSHRVAFRKAVKDDCPLTHPRDLRDRSVLAIEVKEPPLAFTRARVDERAVL